MLARLIKFIDDYSLSTGQVSKGKKVNGKIFIFLTNKTFFKWKFFHEPTRLQGTSHWCPFSIASIHSLNKVVVMSSAVTVIKRSWVDFL